MALSYSKLGTYRRCPKQYEYASVMKIPRAISAGESFGSSIHNTLKRWGELELSAQPQKPNAKKQLTLFLDEPVHHDVAEPLTQETLLSLWRRNFIAEGYENRAAMDEKFKAGEEALRHFFAWWSEKKRDVVCVEQSFKLHVTGDIILNGRFDRIERGPKGLAIIDFKTTVPRAQENVDSDLQLSVYALAAIEEWNEPIESLTLLCIGESGIVEQRTTRSKTQLDQAKTTIAQLAEGIAAKDFTPKPTMEKCRYCPYRDICPAKAA